MKKFFAMFMTAVMLVACLAGCGGSSEPAPAASTPAPAASTPAPAAPAAPSGGDAPAEGGEINVAFIGNLTGDYAMYGVPVHNAVVMYFDQLNAAGGVNGKTVNLISYDDKADGTESVNAFNLAMEQDISAVFGSVLTGATIALADATYDANVPQITASATNPGVTLLDPDAGVDGGVRENVFRACFLDPFQGEKMAEYAAEQGAKNVAMFYEMGSDYSEAIVTGFESVMADYGLTVVDKEAFATGDKDYKAQMTNIAAKNPDMVFMPIYYGEAGLAITALRAAGCTAPVVGGDGFGSVKDYASAEDLEGTVYFSGYAPGTDSVAQFEADYKAAYGEDVPNMFAPLAWDACLIMTEGLKAAEAAGLEPGTDEYRQAVIDGMDAVNGLEGITGSYVFNESNDPVKSVAVIKVEGGAEVFDRFF